MLGMRLILVLLLGLCGLSATALRAQTADNSPAGQELRALIAQAETALAPGTPDAGTAAFVLIDKANDLALATPDLSVPLGYMPNLLAARAYRLQFDWPNMEGFAAPVVRVMDAPQYITHPMRLEAAARLGQAMIMQGRGTDAASILGPVIAATEDAAPSDALDLARFWYGEAMLISTDPGWTTAAARAFGLHTSPLIGPIERAMFLDDYLSELIDSDAPTDLQDDVGSALYDAARAVGVHPVDRALFMNRVASVMTAAGETSIAIAVVKAELDQLGAGYSGHYARTALASQLVRLMFMTGDVEEGIALADTILVEVQARDTVNWPDVSLFHTMRAAAFAYLERTPEAQDAYRRAYVAVRQYERASSAQAQNMAAQIDVDDPGFAGFEYAGELIGAGGIRPDGPADEVMLRFLAGEYAINEQVLTRIDWTGQQIDMTRADRNRALHLALSGQARAAKADLDTQIAALAPAQVTERDELTLFQVVSTFWWQGRGPRGEPALFAALQRLTANLPPDRALFVRAAIASAFAADGRYPEAQAALRAWRLAADARDAAPVHTPWDVAAGMMAVELAYSVLDRDSADAMAKQASAWMQGQPTMGLARDYFDLVRLLNGQGDMETDRGLLDLGAIVQRLSAQVPEGHILRVTSRFGLAKALWARDRLPQARDMMAATTDALRENPDFRPDFMAFFQSVQAQILSQMGNDDLALNMARAAYAALTPQSRGDLRVGIVVTLSNQLVAMGRYGEAATMAEAQLDDAALMADLVPDLRIEILRARARLQDNIDAGEKAGALLTQAEQIAASASDVSAIQRMALIWDRGVHEDTAGRLEPAFRAYAGSNDQYFAERARIADASISGQASALDQDMKRVLIEVGAGWALSQSLDGPLEGP